MTPPTLPREIASGVWWFGVCLGSNYEGEEIHGHMSVFLVMGHDRTLLVDTGHPLHWQTVSRDLERILDGRSLDYVFPTHPEAPHCGNVDRLLDSHPEATVVGEVQDLRLVFPEHANRMLELEAGDELELGGRRLRFVSAVWRDLPTTLWAFDDASRTLFVADAFAFVHDHRPGGCGLLASEFDVPPHPDQASLITELALRWTRYVDVTRSFGEIDALVQSLDVQVIAPAHGSVVSNPEDILPVIKEGMSAPRIRRLEVPASTPGP